ncbi:MAG: tail fiber domain-containing protein [Acidobacteriota bacterium]
MNHPKCVFTIALVVTLLGAGVAFAADDADVQQLAAPDAMSFLTTATHDGAMLRIATPDGETFEVTTGPDGVLAFPAFRADGSYWPDGIYSWELRTAPVLSAAQRQELEDARAAGTTPKHLPKGIVRSGSFSILGGSFVDTSLVEEGSAIGGKVGQASPFEDLPTKAQVINNDLVVVGSTCTGLDCVNSESFGFDTLRLKENNLRIHFNDTSNSASFPSTDWRLVANDTSNGGDNYLAIEDSTTGRLPFRVEGGAPVHTLVVEADGDIGVKTLNPVVDIHVVEGNTPTLRLEQDGSDGFTPQTYDIASNEANFFIRDVTNNSRLFFRSKPGAPEDSIFIAADGDVGLNTDGPAAALHVRRNNSVATDMLLLENNSAVSLELSNTAGTGSGGNRWFLQADSDAEGALNISKRGTGGVEVEINDRLDAAASGAVPTMEVFGSIRATNVTFASSRELKTGFSMVDGEQVLAKLAEIPVQTWRYKTETDNVLHMGPIAEDFAQAFGLGHSDEHITVTDINGVALAAIQGLHQRQTAEIERLEAQVAVLQAQVEALLAAQTAD